MTIKGYDSDSAVMVHVANFQIMNDAPTSQEPQEPQVAGRG